ncbi:tetratricopeptide repeat protein [Streptomyces cyaneofuscatus]|uniref:tetratricopeptide repeat protein n=1 Tax=Streptomyces cyaneofuscatus TaxID=66883 RepID=UPI00382CC9D7
MSPQGWPWSRPPHAAPDENTTAAAGRPPHSEDGRADAPLHLKVSAASDSIAVGGNTDGSAVGTGNIVYNIHEEHTHHTTSPSGEVLWPVEVGPVPALASAFQPRSALRRHIDAARARTTTVVLTQVLSGGGGVGKTQLAAACAADALTDSVDLVVWVTATELQQVITQYAQAAARIHLPGATGKDPQSDARTLLDWLATTDRRWLVVLDDITDPVAITPWWPTSRTGTGHVLATTRLKDARLTGGNRTRIDVDVYTPEEAVAYLTLRLGHDRTAHLLDDQAPALAQALGHLPLALGHAAAYMVNEDLTCTQYLAHFRRTRLEHALPDTADAEGYGREITATLLLTLEAIDRDSRGPLARSVLHLTALLDPAGHPRAFWTASAALTHLTPHPDTSQAQATLDQIHTVLRLLDRYALIAYAQRAEPRAVRMHALTGRAVRESLTADEFARAARVAADALLEVWPEVDQVRPDLAAVLRANTDALADHAPDFLWEPDGHPVLFRAGVSLRDTGLAAPAITYWQAMAATSRQRLGEDHLDTVTARANLASSYRQAGRTREAIAIEERVVADREQLLGEDHPSTVLARANLASSYWQAGRTREAIAIEERVVTDSEQLLGKDHLDTVTARANLASSYGQAGRTREAIAIKERVVADRERLLGEDHPSTVRARANLASSYWQAGRTGEAMVIDERVVADRERLLGEDHPDTVLARANLASSYWQAGRAREAMVIEERVVADRERLLGEDHPSTVLARANLAVSYWQAGRVREAMVIEERVVADRERLLGEDHPDTVTARANLAVSYGQAGRTGEAIELLERVVADSERLLGEDHPDTVNARQVLSQWGTPDNSNIR